MKLLMVGGTFDDDGGRKSSLIRKFYDTINETNSFDEIVLYNGGNYSEIEHILDSCKDFDVVIWWANIPNDKPKLRDVKSINPRCMLVTSKRNDNKKYSIQELINRALGIKSNLCIEFSKDTKTEIFNMMIFDPLGNSWYNGSDIKECCTKLIDRIFFLDLISRQGCINVNDMVGLPNDISEYLDMIRGEDEFFNLIKEYAEVFHKLISPAEGVTRFLGNSSFRCQRGFPSIRKNDIIFMSKRNIDKRYIDIQGFVPTKLHNNEVLYWGPSKPSVDTPVQLNLYKLLPKIEYMIHAHVYIKDAPFTTHMIPCGGLEEISEVIGVIDEHYEDRNADFYAVNLVGHGCIVMSSTVDKMKNLPYVGRIIPERIVSICCRDKHGEDA